MATRILSRSIFSRISSSTAVIRLRPLAAAASTLHREPFQVAARGLATRTTSSSLNDPNPNWSNRPPKETILLDGCDFEHWLVVMEKPEGDPTRDEIIDSYIKTLATVLGGEVEARMKIYSVSTRHYFAFGALVSEELSYKLKELPKVRWVLPDSYLDVKNKDYGGEPFINGQAVPYDPKYHEEWVRNNARADDRNRRNDRPRNFDRSRNFERRRENMQTRDVQNRGPPPNMPPPQHGMPPPNTSPHPGNFPPPNAPQPPNMSPYPGNFPPPNAPQNNFYSAQLPQGNVPQNSFAHQNNSYPPSPQTNYSQRPQNNYPPHNNFSPQNGYPQQNIGNFPQPGMSSTSAPQHTQGFPPQNNWMPPPQYNAGRHTSNDAGAYSPNMQNGDYSGNGPQVNSVPERNQNAAPGFRAPSGNNTLQE